MTENLPLLSVRNLLFSRGTGFTLKVSEFSLGRGQVTALIGPNGSGKSTFLQVLAALLEPERMNLAFEGREVGDRRERDHYRRRIAMVFQEPLLFRTTVFGNVAAGLKFRGMRGTALKDRVREYLELFGIAGLENRQALTLSGGEAQRASLARAFALRPEIIFLDEPFASLDAPVREGLIGDLERIFRRSGTAAVMATHDRNEALALADTLAVFREGRIVQSGDVTGVMNHPRDEFTAGFVGVETILEGTVSRINRSGFFTSVEDKTLEAAGRAQVGERVLLCIRPENVVLSLGRSGGVASVRNRFRGRVERISPAGPVLKVVLDCGFPLVSFVTGHAREELGLKPGSMVYASFKASAIHVIRRKN